MAFCSPGHQSIDRLFMIRKNPYPLVFKCLRVSGVTAFFTEVLQPTSPVNMRLCEELGLNQIPYSVSIPLGSTINMAGAAVTINILTLAAANTLHIQVDFGTALILSVVAAISACGASGVAGGSLLLIPVACSLFGITNDLAMQVVSVGFIIGVIQDSCETALNSSTDVLFTAIAEMSSWPKENAIKKILSQIGQERPRPLDPRAHYQDSGFFLFLKVACLLSLMMTGERAKAQLSWVEP